MFGVYNLFPPKLLKGGFWYIGTNMNTVALGGAERR